jgi:hypothetical protein
MALYSLLEDLGELLKNFFLNLMANTSLLTLGRSGGGQSRSD